MSRYASADINSIFLKRKRFFQKQIKKLKKGTLFIHVVGTKGKGSTCEYLRLGCMQLLSNRKMLTNGNNQLPKVGVFSSPHIHTARERVKINSTLIDRDVSYHILFCSL